MRPLAFAVVRRVAARCCALEITCKNWPTRCPSFGSEDESSCDLIDDLHSEGLLLEFDDTFDVPTMHYQLLNH